jgi:hypothetical protein
MGVERNTLFGESTQPMEKKKIKTRMELAVYCLNGST